MQYQLTIIGSLLEINDAMNRLSGNTAIVTGTVQTTGSVTGTVQTTGSVTTQPSNDEHDDTGPANVNAPAADSAGIPWDGRIHSDNKKQNTDGTWRKRRGVDTNTIAAVEAELKLRGSQQGGMYMHNPQTSAPTSNVPMPNPNMPAPMQQHTPAPMQMPQGYVQPGAYPGPAQQYAPPMSYTPQKVMQQPQGVQRVDFSTFMRHISSKFNERDANGAPVIHADVLTGICLHLSQQFQCPVNAITDIAADQRMIDAAQDALIAQGRW